MSRITSLSVVNSARFMLAFLATFVAGCQTADAPNPCSNLPLPTADFSIKEEVGVSGMHRIRYYEVDTVAASSQVYIVLTAADSVNAEYKWTIGSDPRVFKTRTVRLLFDNAVGSVSVSLEVKKGNESGCPAIDGKVSKASKALTVIPAAEAQIFGDFEGYNTSNPAHKFTIRIRPNSLLNLPEGCTYNLRDELTIGSTAMLALSTTFDPAYGAGALSGWGELSRRNKRQLTFDYSYSNPANPIPAPPITDRFIGYRK